MRTARAKRLLPFWPMSSPASRPSCFRKIPGSPRAKRGRAALSKTASPTGPTKAGQGHSCTSPFCALPFHAERPVFIASQWRPPWVRNRPVTTLTKNNNTYKSFLINHIQLSPYRLHYSSISAIPYPVAGRTYQTSCTHELCKTNPPFAHPSLVCPPSPTTSAKVDFFSSKSPLYL